MNHPRRIVNFFPLFFGAAVGLAVPAASQSTLSLDVGQATHTIKREIYGGLLENTSTDIYKGLYVGSTSSIPNVNGMRKDVIAAFKESGVSSLDWPGGCEAERYDWADGIGPKSSRAGGDMTNGMGTPEYFQLCDSLNSIPYITANITNASVASMTAWLNYIDSLYPNKLKYWKMGNEPWGGCQGLGVPTLSISQYIAKYNTYKVGIPAKLQGKIFRVADGGSGDYLGRTVWIDSLMRTEMGSMEGATFHYYGGFNGAASGFPESEYYSRLASQWLLNGKLKTWDSVMTKYDPEYKVALMVDEWGLWYSNPNQSTCRDAVAASMTFNIFNNGCRRIKMGGVAQPVNFIQPLVLTKNPPTTSLVKTPTLYVFKMYKVHQEAKMVPATLSTTNNQNMPIITASSSVDSTGKLHISMCNTHATANHTVSITLKNAPAYLSCTGTIITGPSYNSYNNFDVAETVNIQNFTGATMNGSTISAVMPAHCVVTLELIPSTSKTALFSAPGKQAIFDINATKNGTILVRYKVTKRTPVSFELFTMDGREAVGSFKGMLDPGRETFSWQPADLGKGTNVYIVKMHSEEGSRSQRIICQR
jgi:alpha-N-arabinofuranosidase